MSAGDESRATIAKVRSRSGEIVFEGFVIVRIGSTLEIVVVAKRSAPSPSDLRELATIVAEEPGSGLAQ